MVTKAKASLLLAADSKQLQKDLATATKVTTSWAERTAPVVSLAKDAFGAVSGAVSTLATTVGEWVGISNVQRTELQQINHLLRQQGADVDAVRARYEAQANAIQRTTTHGDEYVLSIQRQLLALRVNADDVERATRAVLGATAVRVREKTAIQEVAAVLRGEASTTLQDVVGGTKDLDATISILEGTMALLEERTKTTFGAYTQLQNSLADSREELGHYINDSQVAQDALHVLTGRAFAFNDAVGAAGMQGQVDKVIERVVRLTQTVLQFGIKGLITVDQLVGRFDVLAAKFDFLNTHSITGVMSKWNEWVFGAVESLGSGDAGDTVAVNPRVAQLVALLKDVDNALDDVKVKSTTSFSHIGSFVHQATQGGFGGGPTGRPRGRTGTGKGTAEVDTSAIDRGLSERARIILGDEATIKAVQLRMAEDHLIHSRLERELDQQTTDALAAGVQQRAEWRKREAADERTNALQRIALMNTMGQATLSAFSGIAAGVQQGGAMGAAAIVDSLGSLASTMIPFLAQLATVTTTSGVAAAALGTPAAIPAGAVLAGAVASFGATAVAMGLRLAARGRQAQAAGAAGTIPSFSGNVSLPELPTATRSTGGAVDEGRAPLTVIINGPVIGPDMREVGRFVNAAGDAADDDRPGAGG